ncbi:MAG TPA: flagellar export chaperone FliS [Polyangiaceae bacterium]|nr:flagellar export chaperone FliS [Polyangiaceae bacterium]
MFEAAVARYTQIRNTTSTPGELLLALYDGLFRFLNGAKACIEQKDLIRARELLSKAYAIISELYIALDHSVYPELCQNLEGLYGFAMDRITTATRRAEVEPILEVIQVLTPVREAWRKAVPEAQRENAEANRR